MAESDTQEGPKIVWTFPAIRRFQSDNNILNLGSNLGSVLSGDSGPMRSGPVRDKINERRNNSSDGDNQFDEHTAADDLEDTLDEVSEAGSSVFDSDYGQGEDSENLVEIEEDVFVPTKLEIEEGETVRWVNEDNQTHKVMSIDGETLDSGTLEPDDEYEHTFDDGEGVTIYIDSIRGGDVMSGAIIVGDVELEEELPSETGATPVPFENDEEDVSTSTENNQAPRSMSQAAEDKDEMEIGF